MSQYGLIYIITNKKQGKNTFKVGKTSKSIDERLKQLNSETGLLGKFEVFATFVVDDIDKAEKECHKNLKDFRIQNNREFFEVDFINILFSVRKSISKYLMKEQLFVELTESEKKSLTKEKNKDSSYYKSNLTIDSDNIDADIVLAKNKLKSKELSTMQKNEDLSKSKINFFNKVRELKKAFSKYPQVLFLIEEDPLNTFINGAPGVRITISKGTKDDIKSSHDFFKFFYVDLQKAERDTNNHLKLTNKQEDFIDMLKISDKAKYDLHFGYNGLEFLTSDLADIIFNIDKSCCVSAMVNHHQTNDRSSDYCNDVFAALYSNANVNTAYSGGVKMKVKNLGKSLMIIKDLIIYILNITNSNFSLDEFRDFTILLDECDYDEYSFKKHMKFYSGRK